MTKTSLQKTEKIQTKNLSTDSFITLTEVALKSHNPTFVYGFRSSVDFAAAKKLARQQSLISCACVPALSYE